MAVITCKMRSESLQTMTEVRVYYPCDLPAAVGSEVKGVVTLLHGFTNDSESWQDFTAAIRYAADNGLALVMPDASNSFYQDMVYGGAYYTWLTQEMPALLGKMLRLPAEREKNFICGLSMGGYGALLLALREPGRYAACASFSGAVDVGLMLAAKEQAPAVGLVFGPVFGPELALPEQADLYRLAEKVSRLPRAQQPRILCTVGRQDHAPYFIYEQNARFCEFARRLPLDYTYMEWDGVHEWNFWDRSLVQAIDLFIQPGYAGKVQSGWAAPIQSRGANT